MSNIENLNGFYLIEYFVRQYIQDFMDFFLALSHFPEGNEKTQSPTARENAVATQCIYNDK